MINKDSKNITDYIIKEVGETIVSQNLIEDNDKIVVAVSGGPDSITLLDVLVKLKRELNINYEIIVAHVNHMIREESEEEKVYVENMCKKYGVEFNYLKTDVKKISKIKKISEEMAGRDERYRFFDELLNKKSANKIVVAHNLDDNAETVLLNIIRGTGIKGLSGMQYKNGNIIRPLLNIKKCDILLYTEENHLNPCFDKTNNENVYLRNKIRNILIPELKSEYNSNIVQNIIRMSKLLCIDDSFLEEYTKGILDNTIIAKEDKSITFNFSHFDKTHEAINRRYVRCLLSDLDLLDGIQNVNIEDILEHLNKNIKGKKYIKKGKFEVVILKKNVAKIFVGEEI